MLKEDRSFFESSIAVIEDLRKKVVAKYNTGQFTQEDISNIFDIGTSTIKRWLKLEREIGALLRSCRYT